MDKDEAERYHHYQSTQRTSPDPEPPARPSSHAISHERFESEAGSDISLARDPDEATAHDEGARFTSGDKDGISAVSVAAMIRLRSRFSALDDIIQLYQGFEIRFSKLIHHCRCFYYPLIIHAEDDLLGWASNMHGYLLEIFEAICQVISERTPTVAHHIDPKGWLYSAANKLEYPFYNIWSAESFDKFNAEKLIPNTFRSGSAIWLQGAAFPSDFTHGSPRDHHHSRHADDKDPGGRSERLLEIGPGEQEKVEAHRRLVRDALIDPLTVAMANWEEEANRDIEDMKRVLWGV